VLRNVWCPPCLWVRLPPLVYLTVLTHAVVWPGGWDQPHVASEVCQLGIARELVQVRTGHNIGRETARGILVEGTDEAIALEMEEVFRFMVSEQAERMMKRCEEVRELVKEDMERGDSHKNMLALGAL
jgi:S-adenosylmethionine:diacylglycerol 3-amino-3-carboxypropyl transferase